MRESRGPFQAGKRPSGGFTLLEMVVVLALGALLVGGALGVMLLSDNERVMKGGMGHVENLAKRARTAAILQQTPYSLEFTQSGVRMMPLSEALLPPDAREQAAARAAGSRFAPVHAQWVPDADMLLSVKRWASDEWLPVAEKSRHLWRFDPDGICEPLGVRIQVEKSWLEVEFHPLTAGVHDTMMEANK